MTEDSNTNSNTVCEEDLSPELYSYLSKDIETKLPNYINQKRLLQFDSNFESGNLDSVYLVNETEYNLLCKADTNTKGNTYWFYFKVLGWTPKAKATFNILNIARDLAPFYNKGMQIWSRCESTNGKYKSDWECSKNVKMLSFQPNDIVRSKGGKKEYACGKYYNTLKFRCEFPEIPMLKPYSDQDIVDDAASVSELSEVGPNDVRVPGTVMCFAYALPFTYSDLRTDLEYCRKFLLRNDGQIVNEVEQSPGRKKKRLNKATTVPDTNFEGLVSKRPNKRDRMDREILSKNEIAQRELKKAAIRNLKEKMGQFEINLLKADEENSSPVIKMQSISQGPKLLEIHTDYLYYKQEIVSQSVGGLNIYQITLTKRKNCLPYHKKRCMYVTSRMHSAETHGSFIMRSILNELVTRAENYDSFLSNYVVKLVPMINTDGVTIGNTRSSLVGLDLNRRWAQPNASIHPEIYFLKQIMLAQANSPQGIQIFCDLHGHNRKENCFFYGCNKAADEGMLSWTKTRLLPKIFASIEQIFDFSNCRFNQDRFKLSTARVVVWNEMKVTNSFTLETSMYCKTVDKATKDGLAAVTSSVTSVDRGTELTYVQLQISDLSQIAKSFLVSSAQYSKLEKELEKECKLQFGWFKPSQLNQLTGEAARDKLKRQLTTKKKKQDKDSVTRKKIERMNSSSFVEPSNRRRVTKLNSGQKLESNSKQNAKEIMIVKPKAKRQQSLLNVLGSASKQGVAKKGSAFNVIDDASSVKEKSSKKEKDTAKKLKGPKVAIQSIDNDQESTIIGDGLPIVTKLKSWQEFFDLEEFESGLRHMQNTDKVLTELSEKGDESGSDSNPSEDNFDQKELQENLNQALDIQEGEPDPFIRPLPSPTMRNQNIRISELSEQEDLSDNGGLEEPLLDESTKDDQVQDHLDNEFFEMTGSQQVEPSENENALPKTSDSHRQAINSRGTSLTTALEQERVRIMNHPDLANQLINQLILQQNAKQMKASAAPPSGIGAQANQSFKINDPSVLNHVLRGTSYTNQVSQAVNAQPAADSNAVEPTIYFTDQHRRMAKRQPSTQFTVQGQAVTAKTSTQATQDNSLLSSRRQTRKMQSHTKGLVPLPTQQIGQLGGQMVDEHSSYRKAGFSQDSRQINTRMSSQRGRAQLNSESRHTNRGKRQISNNKEFRLESVRVEKSFETNVLQNPLNETQGSSSSKKYYSSVRASTKEVRTNSKQKKSNVVLEQQRVQEAQKLYEQLVGNYNLMFGSDGGAPNFARNQQQQPEANYALAERREQNRDRLDNQGRYSYMKNKLDDSTPSMISPKITPNKDTSPQFIHQFAYSPIIIANDQSKQGKVMHGLSAPRADKQQFSTPRYMKLIKPGTQNNVNSAEDSQYVGIRKQTQPRSENISNLLEETKMQVRGDFTIVDRQASETNENVPSYVDISGNRIMTGDRPISNNTSSFNYTMTSPMKHPNGFDMHKDLLKKSQQETDHSLATTQMFVTEEGYSLEGKMLKKAILGRASEQSSDRATPMIGQMGGKRREVQIRKNRNLRQLRPSGLSNPAGQESQTFDQMLRIDQKNIMKAKNPPPDFVARTPPVIGNSRKVLKVVIHNKP